MDTKTMLSLPMDGVVVNVTTSIKGNRVKSDKDGNYPKDAWQSKDKDGKPVLDTNGKALWYAFPPTPVTLKINLTGIGQLHNLIDGVVKPQLAIKWGNKCRPLGKQFCLDNQDFDYSFLIKENNTAPAIDKALKNVDKISDPSELEKIIAAAQAKLANKQ